MKFYLLLYILVFMIPEPSKTLADYRWKNRLVITDFDNLKLDSLLKGNEQSLLDRKLVFISFHDGKFQSASDSAEIESKQFLNILSKTDSSAEWVLIGLDGGVKASGKQLDFSLSKITTLIDQMPMRQSEIN
ncbi:DUF4174 domain-containing protein [Algoriphagus sp.]|uniref:DUF4174 domain-containing protein n=2 Tax=Algoriphagus sp. TaxID=1872435 RepID=UPI00327C52EB